MNLCKVTSVLALGLAACGGSDSGEPLLAGSMTGEYNGHSFTPAFGFATLYNGAGLIVVGDGPIHCGTESANDPPSGTNAVLSVPLEVGSRTNVFVQLTRNIDGFEGAGANTGSVTVSAVSESSVVGTVTFDYTDTQSRHFSIIGGFEVLHCAP
ncbi:hypothetical protein BH11MYX3_BH11MYX3_21490 [soil metagenome]